MSDCNILISLASRRSKLWNLCLRIEVLTYYYAETVTEAQSAPVNLNTLCKI